MYLNKDLECQPACTDGISDVCFSPTADFISASSWDGQTRIWEVTRGGGSSGGSSSSNQLNSVAKAAIPHDGPVLATTWSADGSKVFSAGADKIIKMMDMATGVVTPLGAAHEAPIKCLKWMSTNNGNTQALVSGSWDKTIRYWDLRSPAPIGVLTLPERCYAMDTKNDLLVAATAERNVCVVNLTNPMTIWKNMVSPLKWQTRSIQCYHDASGFAIGSIEGRCGLHWLDEKEQSKDFAYRCHRDGNKAYAVNALSFHPLYGSFTTSGSDGFIYIWDKDSKQKLDNSSDLGSPISATAFNRDGSLFAYALSYEWSKGHEHYKADAKNSLMVHSVMDSEVKPRNASSLVRRR